MRLHCWHATWKWHAWEEPTDANQQTSHGCHRGASARWRAAGPGATAGTSAPNSVQGQLVRVDAASNTITIRTETDTQIMFTYNDETKVTGTDDNPAGLATMSGTDVKVEVHKERPGKHCHADRGAEEAGRLGRMTGSTSAGLSPEPPGAAARPTLAAVAGRPRGSR